MIIHIPLWKSFRNEETKRLYLRFETLFWPAWRSGGRNKDLSFKTYYHGWHLDLGIGVCHGKVKYSCLKDEY